MERAETAALISGVVRELTDVLPTNDRLLLRLRFESEMSVPQIARSMQIEPQLLYRRLYDIFRELRKNLEAAGVRAADVSDLIGQDTEFLDFELKKSGAASIRRRQKHGSDPAGGNSS